MMVPEVDDEEKPDCGRKRKMEAKEEKERHGAVSVMGKRRMMEDAVAVERGFWDGWDFYGVYDGHGGAEVAEACRERIHVAVAEAAERRAAGRRVEGEEEVEKEEGEEGWWWWREAMEEGFRVVDEEVAAWGIEDAEVTVGATAVVAVVGEEAIVVANCGDSRAVLCRRGVPIPLSSDHKPNRPDEMKRVEAAGGKIINWDGYRVLGVLATSRSIGDQYLKPYVTSQPEVTITTRTGGDEFLILASDGLWDVVSNKVACCVVRRCLAGRLGDRPPVGTAAAVALVELAISRGSQDNITVVVVELRSPGSVVQSKKASDGLSTLHENSVVMAHDLLR